MYSAGGIWVSVVVGMFDHASFMSTLSSAKPIHLTFLRGWGVSSQVILFGLMVRKIVGDIFWMAGCCDCLFLCSVITDQYLVQDCDVFLGYFGLLVIT